SGSTTLPADFMLDISQKDANGHPIPHLERTLVGTQFGGTLALSGTHLLVGNPGYDASPAVTGSGPAYLYDITNGKLLQSFFNPTPQSFDGFGSAVALADNSVLIGSHDNLGRDITDTLGLNFGAAYLFDGSTGGLVYMYQEAVPRSHDGLGN